jgi:hypothetical protein
MHADGKRKSSEFFICVNLRHLRAIPIWMRLAALCSLWSIHLWLRLAALRSFTAKIFMELHDSLL